MEVSSWENHLSINIFSQQAIFDFYIDYIDYIDLWMAQLPAFVFGDLRAAKFATWKEPK